MARDENVIIMGEDMGKMGNVFGITVGFQEEFGENRVFDTPISESGFCGMAVGAAMRGIRPVVELMYDDFITVAADPIINQAAKMRYMTGGQAIRTHGIEIAHGQQAEETQGSIRSALKIFSATHPV